MFPKYISHRRCFLSTLEAAGSTERRTFARQLKSLDVFCCYKEFAEIRSADRTPARKDCAPASLTPQTVFLRHIEACYTWPPRDMQTAARLHQVITRDCDVWLAPRPLSSALCDSHSNRVLPRRTTLRFDDVPRHTTRVLSA